MERPGPIPRVRPPVCRTQPTLRRTRPTVRHTRPTVRHTRPTVRHTRPTVRHTRPTVRHAPPAARAAALCLALPLALLLALVTRPAPLAGADVPDRYAGTYRIEGWRELEARDLHHFFYLQPDGHFLLGAEWPGKEQSLFVGTWSVADDRLTLTGAGHVQTHQGAWRTSFERTYRIRVEPTGFVLEPEPQKNRYGLLGWPQTYTFYRRQPAPNLPGAKLPADSAALAQHIAALLAEQK